MSSTMNKLPKCEVTDSIQSTESDSEYDKTEHNIKSGISHILDAIDDLASMTYMDYMTYRGAIRSKLYNAVGILRDMLTDKGTHINALPDDCLVSIFSKAFSTQSMLVRLRPVCSRWKQAIESFICSPKRSLKLFGSRDAVLKYAQKMLDLNLFADQHFKLGQIGHRDNDLVLSYSRKYNEFQQFFNYLGTIFPNVQHLILSISAWEQKELAFIIAQWPHISRLSLFVDGVTFTREDVGNPWKYLNAFFDSVNSLASLKHLDLYGDPLSIGDISYDLKAILPRLEQFSLENSKKIPMSNDAYVKRLLKKYLGNPDENTEEEEEELHYQLKNALTKLGPNLKGLRLEQFSDYETILRTSLNGQLAANITELRLSNVNQTQIGKFVCETFPQLKRLDISAEISISLDSNLINHLSRLPHLRELSLEHISIDLDTFDLLLHLPQLSSVQSLHLSNLHVTPGLTDGKLVCDILSRLFPNLHELDYQFGYNRYSWMFNLDDCCLLDEDYVWDLFPLLRKCRVYYKHCKEEYLGMHSNYSHRDCRCDEKLDDAIFDSRDFRKRQ